jgi:cytochrome P450
MCGDILAMPGLPSQLLLSQQGRVFPGNLPLLGHLPLFFWSLWRAHGNLARAFERLFRQIKQPTFRVKLGPQWFILTLDPDLMHHILVTEFAHYRKTQHECDVLSPSMAGGLITAEGEEWKRHRQILRPFFGTDYVKRLTTFVQEALTERVAQWQEVIDVDDEMQRVTFDIFARFFLGGKIGASAEERSLAFYTQHLHYMEKVIESRALSLPRLKDFLFSPLKYKTKFAQSYKAIQALLAQRIRQSVYDEPAILQQLCKEFGSEEVVVQELFTLISASFGSTHVLAWICALLAHDPERQQKLHTEIAHFVQERPETAELTLDHLEHLPYLAAVVYEGLRLYPPAPYIIRTLAACPGAPHLILSIWSMHRHPAFWPQPDAFAPERWLAHDDTPGAAPDTSRHLRTFAAFLPFGAGPRMCIGRAFALVELKLILLGIMQRFTLRLVDPVLPAAKATILTRPQQRIRLQVVPVQTCTTHDRS